MEQIRNKKGFICDMDGVIYHGEKLLNGAKEFVQWLKKEKKRFLFLTNSSGRSPQDLKEKHSTKSAKSVVNNNPNPQFPSI